MENYWQAIGGVDGVSFALGLLPDSGEVVVRRPACLDKRLISEVVR